MKLTLQFYKCFLCFTFLFGLTAHSQIVTIPDPEFKQALLNYSPNIDTNNDNEIQVTEAEAITSLTISGHQYFMDPGMMDPITGDIWPGGEFFGITDFTGIEAFINLTYLNCSYNDITSLNISTLTQLTYLDCSSNINYNGTPYGGTGIATLVLPTSAILETFNASTNTLAGTLDLSTYTSLAIINCGGNQISTLTLPTSNALQSLNCSSNQLANLSLTPYAMLTSLNCRSNQITALDPSQNTLLTSLDCYSNQITTLDVLQNTLLTSLICSYNQITDIDVTQQTTALTKLVCNNNNLSSLSMKNGNNTAITNYNFDARNNANLALICVDNIAYASANFNNVNGQSFFAEVCSFIPTMSNIITGTISYDFDVNGCDPADFKSVNTKIATLGSSTASTTFSAADGTYTLYTFDGSTDTSITPNFPSFFSVTPTTQNSTFTGSGNTDIVDYCITANSVVNDVQIQVFSIEEARPGFDTSVRVLYKNIGSTILSGDFDFTFENNKQTFLNASITPDSQTVNSLSWNYTSLLPFESRFVDVFLNTNTPTDLTNPVVNGDTLNYSTSITSTTGDVNASDNTNAFVGITIGSYDPNDVTIRQGDNITPAEALEFLNFRIRFQNTGTASAINIRVETLLDADLDWDTFEPISASHDYRTSLTDNNKVQFFFENIYLPDSTTDEPGSNGWVYFKIKPVAGFAIGDLVEATAGIYFDFNPPVITNTATTEIPATLSTDSFNNDSIFSLFPNPASTQIIITIREEARFSLVNINGQTLKTGSFENGENILDISTLSNGLYFLQVVTSQGVSTKKIIKQ